MNKRRFLFFFIVAAILAALVVLQVRQWHKFDWATFRDETQNLRWELILASVMFVYLADSLRAWRWAIFLRPVAKVDGAKLVAPQFIGFAGLALSSQMAVWTVERIFDFATVTSFLLLDLAFSRSLEELGYYDAIRTWGL